MERFRRQSDEKTLMKGPITYLRGEQTFKAIMFHGAALDCKAVLTSQRFVALQERKWNTMGPLFFVVALFIPKKMIFEIPLDDLSSVRYGEEDKGNHELILKTVEGAEYNIRLTSAKDTFGGDTRKKWIKTMTDAAKELRPELEVKDDEKSAEFIRSQK